MSQTEKMQIMDEKAMRMVLSRMAHEIVERHSGATNLVFVGMQTRGVFLARRIAELIESLENLKLNVGVLDITLYRDDFRSPFKQPSVRVTEIPFSINGKDVILVDDVLFTGRTVRAALDALTDFGRAATIQLAVLIDRGGRELPINADYVGRAVPVKAGEEIAVRMQETDAAEGVWLVDAPAK